MEALLVWVIQRVGKFPREHRFTVGDRLIDTCPDVSGALVEASFRRDKAALLASASRALVRARVLVRVAHELRLLSESQHLYFATESSEVGRMLGGWHRSLATRAMRVEPVARGPVASSGTPPAALAARRGGDGAQGRGEAGRWLLAPQNPLATKPGAFFGSIRSSPRPITTSPWRSA